MNWLELAALSFLLLAIGSVTSESRWTRIANGFAPFMVWSCVVLQCVQLPPNLPTLFVVIALWLFGLFSTLGHAQKNPFTILATGFLAASVLHSDPAWRILYVWIADAVWIGLGGRFIQNRGSIFAIAKVAVVSLLPATFAAVLPRSDWTPILVLTTIFIRTGAGPLFSSPFKHCLNGFDDLVFLSGFSGVILWFAILPQSSNWSLTFLGLAALSVITLDVTALFVFFSLALLNSNGAMEFLFCALALLVALRSKVSFYSLPLVFAGGLYLLGNDLTKVIEPNNLAPFIFGGLGALMTRAFLLVASKPLDKKFEIGQASVFLLILGLGIYFQNSTKWEAWTDAGVASVGASVLLSGFWFWLKGAKPKTNRGFQIKQVWPMSFAFLKKTFYRWSFEWSRSPRYIMDTPIARFSEKCAAAMHGEFAIVLFSLGFSIAVTWWVMQ